MSLPEGWARITLADHIYIAARIGWRGLKAEEYTASGPILLSVPNLNHGDEVHFGTVHHLSTTRFDESPEIQLRVGDTLLVKDGAGIGKLGYVASLPGPATVNSSLLVVRPLDSLLLHKYLFYYLKGPELQSIAHHRITGSATPHLFQKDIKTFEVSVPPPDEQGRIVAKLDALLARVRGSQERLANIQAILKRFRQAVLTAGCSGRLTEDWRKDRARQPFEDPVCQITKHRGGKSVPEIVKPPGSAEETPVSWRWVAFGSVIGELRNGVSERPAMKPPGTPILRISAARPGFIDLSDVRFIKDATPYLPTFRLKEADLLFTRYNGSLELLGTCGMVRGIGSTDVLYPDKLMRVRFDHPYVLPAYTAMFFSSAGARERMIDKAKSSAGQNGVSGSDVKAQAFSLPPTDEQQEIVRRVQALFAFSDRLEARLKNATQQVEQLTQSILAKAFRGELVPTEAEIAGAQGRAYETAEELLKRIRADRDQALSKRKGEIREKRIGRQSG